MKYFMSMPVTKSQIIFYVASTFLLETGKGEKCTISNSWQKLIFSTDYFILAQSSALFLHPYYCSIVDLTVQFYMLKNDFETAFRVRNERNSQQFPSTKNYNLMGEIQIQNWHVLRKKL